MKLTDVATFAAPDNEEYSNMSVRPRLISSIPFWVLAVGSLVSAAAGAWLVFGTLPDMIQALNDQTATGTQVYGGQSWVVVGAVLLGAGVVGVLITLAIAAVSSIIPVAAPTETVILDDVADDDFAIVEAVAPATVAAPVTPAEPVASEAAATDAPADAPAETPAR